MKNPLSKEIKFLRQEGMEIAFWLIFMFWFSCCIACIVYGDIHIAIIMVGTLFLLIGVGVF